MRNWGSERRDTENRRAAVETAWRIHAAQTDWTGKVDAKATFAFAAESAAIATVVALTAQDRLYSQIDVWWLWAIYVVGLAGMLVAVGLSSWVVIPRLRKSAVAKESRTNFIYFGHASVWSAEELETALLKQDILPQITRQVVVMARIAWKKHVLVQWSLWIAVASGFLLVGAGLFASFLP